MGRGRKGDNFAEYIELACTSLKANLEETVFLPLTGRAPFLAHYFIRPREKWYTSFSRLRSLPVSCREARSLRNSEHPGQFQSVSTAPIRTGLIPESSFSTQKCNESS